MGRGTKNSFRMAGLLLLLPFKNLLQNGLAGEHAFVVGVLFVAGIAAMIFQFCGKTLIGCPHTREGHPPSTAARKISDTFG